MPGVPLRRHSRRDHLIVCGDNPLARQLVDELTRRFHENVTVIVSSKKGRTGRYVASLSGVQVVEADVVDEDALRSARVTSARSVSLVNQDDVGNIHTALRARELNPTIRLVLHMFNSGLGSRVGELFDDCAIMSDSEVAAPAFVEAALAGQRTPSHLRVPGHILVAKRAADTRHERIVCGLARTSGDGTEPELLPANQEAADIVLAVAQGEDREHRVLFRLSRSLAGGVAWLRGMLSRQLRIALLTMLGLFVLGTVLTDTFRPDLSWPNSVYLTILDAAGAANPDPDHLSTADKAIQVMVTLVGISLIPVITAAVVDAVVGAQLAAATPRRRRKYRGHVVVVGLGNVGTRVIRRLHDLGRTVVCVENSENATGVTLARRLGMPIVFGDATSDEALELVSVDTCRALLAVTSDDVTNLETALAARAFRPNLRVAVRIGDDDLARRVHHAFKIDVSRSVSYLAAPAFAAAMVQREVIGTIPVDRRVLLVAEVPVRANSPLYGHQLEDVHETGEVRVIAVQADGTDGLDWSTAPDYRLGHDDRLIVVATREGLGRVLASSIPDSDA